MQLRVDRADRTTLDGFPLYDFRYKVGSELSHCKYDLVDLRDESLYLHPKLAKLPFYSTELALVAYQEQFISALMEKIERKASEGEQGTKPVAIKIVPYTGSGGGDHGHSADAVGRTFECLGNVCMLLALCLGS